MYKNVTLIGYYFEEIEKNMKFYVERRETHSKSKLLKLVITEIINTIQNITLFKVATIFTISLLQILLIRKFFGRSGKHTSKSIEGNPFKQDETI